ncbi:hypothetical protein C2S51_023285 [Perilla frutescens var. frutescens]|nr:hypothetical protein C2S51_023285 [Perilla frutescens var. frutescens]
MKMWRWAVSPPIWVEYDRVQTAIQQDPSLSRIIQTLEAIQAGPPHYALVHDHLFYKGRLVVPGGSECSQQLLGEFHSTTSGGHAVAFRTYCRLAGKTVGGMVDLKFRPYSQKALFRQLFLIETGCGQYTREGRLGEQILVKWTGLGVEEATWVDVVDKAVLGREAIDREYL